MKKNKMKGYKKEEEEIILIIVEDFKVETIGGPQHFGVHAMIQKIGKIKKLATINM